MNVNRLISKSDSLLLLELINQCSMCTDLLPSVDDLMRGLQKLMQIDHAVYVLTALDYRGLLSSYNVLNLSYPEEWLQLYQQKKFWNIDPVCKENFTHFGVQFWNNAYKKWGCPHEFMAAAQDFNLSNGYACGMRLFGGIQGGIFSIAGNFDDHPRNRFILNTLSPHLNQALSSILLKTNAGPSTSDLSTREKEVLNWIKQGKSTWDISVILNISERTIKFHVNNIMLKLDASNRSHAVALAMSAGLIDVG